MIRSYTMMKTGSTTGTVCHQGKRIKPDHGPTPEDHDPRKLPLGLGRQAQVIGELQALVEREPLRERLHAQLMRALYATGRQADALGAYQRARAVLAERAGLDPGPELRRLEAQLLAQDPALAIAPELSAAAPRATRPGGPAVRGPDAAPPEPGAAADVTARRRAPPRRWCRRTCRRR